MHIIFFLSLLLHQFFVSITHIHIKEDEQAIEISSSYTGHDIEQWLMDHNVLHGKLETISEDSATYANVSNLILREISVKANKQTVPLELVGMEIKNDDTFTIYILGSYSNTTVSEVSVSNNLLFSTYPQQQHKINFQKGTAVESAAITSPGQVVTFNL